MRYSKITGTFLKFGTGERLETGVSYAIQELHLDQNKIVAVTFTNGKRLETQFSLSGPGALTFTATSDDPSIPEMRGQFLNGDYDECILSASFPAQKLRVEGVVTKLDSIHALGTKIVTESTGGTLVGIMQEKIELISADTFRAATSSPASSR